MVQIYHGVLFLLVIGLVSMDFLVYKNWMLYKWPTTEKYRNKRFILYLVILLAYLVPNYRVMFTYDPRPSPVNASPLGQIPLEQINEERLIAMMNLLQDSDYIRRFESNLAPRQRRFSRFYRFSYASDSRGVAVEINFYWNEHDLAAYLLRQANRRIQRHSSIITNNNNNTQAFLHASFNPRSHGFPTDIRYVITDLRLGNVHISLYEVRGIRDYYPNASTAFIQFLYELLTAEE